MKVYTDESHPPFYTHATHDPIAPGRSRRYAHAFFRVYHAKVPKRKQRGSTSSWEFFVSSAKRRASEDKTAAARAAKNTADCRGVLQEMKDYVGEQEQDVEQAHATLHEAWEELFEAHQIAKEVRAEGVAAIIDAIRSPGDDYSHAEKALKLMGMTNTRDATVRRRARVVDKGMGMVTDRVSSMRAILALEEQAEKDFDEATATEKDCIRRAEISRQEYKAAKLAQREAAKRARREAAEEMENARRRWDESKMKTLQVVASIYDEVQDVNFCPQVTRYFILWECKCVRSWEGTCSCACKREDEIGRWCSTEPEYKRGAFFLDFVTASRAYFALGSCEKYREPNRKKKSVGSKREAFYARCHRREEPSIVLLATHTVFCPVLSFC